MQGHVCIPFCIVSVQCRERLIIAWFMASFSVFGKSRPAAQGAWRALGQTTRPLWRLPFIGASNSVPEVAKKQR